MKLDTGALRYLTSEDWRVLAAVEQGSKNHELVPTPLIQQLAGLRGGSGVHRNISNLAKVGLIAKVKNAKYDGYRLTYGGLDYLALNTHRRSDTIYSLGNQIGVGKESDIYITAAPSGRQLVLKLHRLGRISFRSVKSNRDYLRNRNAGSWMYLSRLAAQKEHAFMRVLYREGFPVPEPIAWSRHTVVMEFIDAFPLRMIESVPEPGKLYAELMDMIVQLAKRGLIHGDFNEFNILIKERTVSDKIKLTPILIDFPQVVSTNHANAEMYFDRDVACVKRYFERRLKYVSDEPGPFFADIVRAVDAGKRLDVEVEASGFSRKMAKDLDRYVETVGGDHTESEGETVENESVSPEESGGDSDEDNEDDNGKEVEDGTADDGGEDEPEADLGVDHRAEDPGLHSPPLSAKLKALEVSEDFAVKPSRFAEYGLVPIDLAQEPNVAEETMKTKKKATGWAI